MKMIFWSSKANTKVQTERRGKISLVFKPKIQKIRILKTEVSRSKKITLRKERESQMLEVIWG